jgi:hypothetical protein
MSRYRFEKIETENSFDKYAVIIEFEAIDLDDMFQFYKMFLQANGFMIDGDLIIDNNKPCDSN